MTGRNFNTQGELFIFRDSEYADDTAAIFTSRENLSLGTKELIRHFRRFGMEVHTGSISKNSEALFVPKASRTYEDPSTHDNANAPPIDCGSSTFIPIVTKFQYLGSYQSSDATDTLDVKERIGNTF